MSSNDILQLFRAKVNRGVRFRFVFTVEYVGRMTNLLKSIVSWLTRKFILGIVIGFLLGSLSISPLPTISKILAIAFLPQVEIVYTWPKDGESFYYAGDRLNMDFRTADQLVP